MGEDQQLFSMLSSLFTKLEELDMSGTRLSNTAAINLFRILQDNNKLKNSILPTMPSLMMPAVTLS